MEVRRCFNCKKRKMKPATIFGKGQVEGWECEGCGFRMAYGDPYAPKGLWPKAQEWIESK
jgi:hypothetical protein